MANGGERGDTLIEVVMAVAILGIAVVAIMGGMVTSVMGSDIHRKQSAATTVLTGSAELLKDTSTGFVPCATPVTYLAAVAAVPRPSGWAAPQITAVTYWDGTGFQATCYDTVVLGRLLRLQSITVQVSSPDGRSIETIQVVKRDAT